VLSEDDLGKQELLNTPDVCSRHKRRMT
jgi:hypothetical protein